MAEPEHMDYMPNMEGAVNPNEANKQLQFWLNQSPAGPVNPGKN